LRPGEQGNFWFWATATQQGHELMNARPSLLQGEKPGTKHVQIYTPDLARQDQRQRLQSFALPQTAAVSPCGSAPQYAAKRAAP
jgi:hypothetical protein